MVSIVLVCCISWLKRNLNSVRKAEEQRSGIWSRRRGNRWMGQGARVKQGREMMSVASVNVWSGRASLRTPCPGDRNAPGCLGTAVGIATFIIS